MDRERTPREPRTRADDMPGALRPQGTKARETLQTLLVDHVDCAPVRVAGTHDYAFTGDGPFGGLLGACKWPTAFGGPNGIRTRLSVTTTFSPAVSDGSRSHTHRNPTRLKHARSCSLKHLSAAAGSNRGSDLNRRPLGYEGKTGGDPLQRQPTTANRNAYLEAPRLGGRGAWFAVVLGEFSESTP